MLVASLQTGMRGAFGKPYGKVARVNINQILISVRTKPAMVVHVVEGLRRCKYKFPGAQKILVSKNWGFTPYSVEEYKKLRAEGRTVSDGAYVKIVNKRGPLKLQD